MSEFNINEDAQSGGEYSGSQSSNNETASQRDPIGDSAFPDEDEDTITMLDVIEREDQLEEEASAVLGNGDLTQCTYSKGYSTRQALYSCATCFERTGEYAAICLACSLECHDNHDVIELYTKRNYRCDCGNGKFQPNFECKLMDSHLKKSSLNELNKYNHNFAGKYCTCDKRYPPEANDDSVESNDEMLQCIVCEDWYHSKHLTPKELPAKYDELICGSCVKRLDFVRYYKTNDNTYKSNPTNSGSSVVSTIQISSPAVECETNHESLEVNQPSSDSTSQQSTDFERNTTKNSENATAVSCESDTNDSQLENKDPSRVIKLNDKPDSQIPLTHIECVLEKYKLECQDPSHPIAEDTNSNASKLHPSEDPIFWNDCSWRSRLCRCPNCLTMYKSKNCEFLLDEKDTVQYYEAQGKEAAKDRETPLERGISALNRMNRTAVVEAVHGFDELKADLRTYLKKFAENKKVVREEDIHEFFTQFKSKKRPRLDDYV